MRGGDIIQKDWVRRMRKSLQLISPMTHYAESTMILSNYRAWSIL